MEKSIGHQRGSFPGRTSSLVIILKDIEEEIFYRMATSRRLQDKNGYINEEVKRVAVELCISVTLASCKTRTKF